ncbi:putative laccase [Podospora fimiseda]|uniref:Laccase n=1 Tax=Podospora fimiseda TaxID=252190 RepID=A0AAN7H556_9PEZI|nr:putative laccase [Podospora fimiseda]
MGRFWVLVTQFLGITTLSPYDGLTDKTQSPLQLAKPKEDDDPLHFKPPGRRYGKKEPGADFKCDYRSMTGWELCSTPEDRSCWLINKETKQRFDINTNYETNHPNGTLREYWLDVTKTDITADGYTFKGATVFNGSYPGPWIQACWGDTVRIHVTNKNPDRGTSIHWHGIRQLNSMHMDGVNGVTQCPIAPGSTFTYEWQVLQYGSSWYHSHYSEQYADGAVGPITLHGPSSGNFDEAADVPILMTDWRHGSMFDKSEEGGDLQAIQGILLNGIGDITQFGKKRHRNTSPIPEPYTLHFDTEGKRPVKGDRPKRYLLRLINTSIGTTFVFSIDNHLLSIVSADFVPIYPYLNSSILIGIGQRYNVIVEANPRANNTRQPLDQEDNYWIRTWVVPNCGTGIGSERSRSPTYMQTGILRYNASSTAKPTSQPWDHIDLTCSDETYTSLRPVLPWIVEDPINTVSTATGIQHVAVVAKELGDPNFPTFPKAGLAFVNHSGLAPQNDTSETPFKLPFTPLQIDFSDPILLSLDKQTNDWNPLWEIFPQGRTGEEDWVWLAITVDESGTDGYEAHPMHLHGHDFAILQQAENTLFKPENIRINRLNPPRRDVVMMPTKGFIIIAFKADNPGSWLLHCHIAAHASAGLALQILERQADANKMWPKGSKVQEEAASLCREWDSWVGASSTATPLPDDSGI